MGKVASFAVSPLRTARALCFLCDSNDSRFDLVLNSEISDNGVLTHPIHERLRLNQTERVDIATSTFPGTSVMWHMRFLEGRGRWAIHDDRE